MKELSFLDVEASHNRIKNFINNTKIINNIEFNQEFGSNFYFKCDNFQKTNSFKARGAFNSIISYQEKHGHFPKKVVVVSSGNHAQAISYVCQKFGIEALIYMDKNASKVKIEKTESYGAKVVVCQTRKEANELSQEKIKDGYVFIHPSNDEDVILGQASACFEALKEIGEVDLIFVPVGGGGLAGGTYLAAKTLSPNAKIIGCEPKIANDAFLSVKQNKIFAFQESPKTIADGARTLAVLSICFEYLKKLDEILEITEEDIILFQQKFLNKTQILIEPTSSLAIAGATQYLKEHNLKNQKILVIISGGNL